MLLTLALLIVAWWVLAVGIALVVGRFIALADARRAVVLPAQSTGPRGERHA